MAGIPFHNIISKEIIQVTSIPINYFHYIDYKTKRLQWALSADTGSVKSSFGYCRLNLHWDYSKYSRNEFKIDIFCVNSVRDISTSKYNLQVNLELLVNPKIECQFQNFKIPIKYEGYVDMARNNARCFTKILNLPLIISCWDWGPEDLDVTCHRQVKSYASRIFIMGSITLTE